MQNSIKSKYHKRRKDSKRKSAWSMCSDEHALNRITKQCTISGGLMSEHTKNGDKCSHAEPESGRLYYWSFRYAKTTAALRRKRIWRSRSERSIVIRKHRRAVLNFLTRFQTDSYHMILLGVQTAFMMVTCR
jgi:hypothetical protein